MTPGKKPAGPGAIELLEEGVHLLRGNPGALVAYFAGSGPFALGLLYFWAYVTWFAPSDGAVAWGALLLVLLFGLMKVGQRQFARELMASRIGAPPPAFAWRKLPTEIAAQLRLQAAGVIVVPLAALFAFPFGWLYAYFQNAVILPADGTEGTAGCRRQAWEQALLWPGQNHRGLAILTVLWLMTFLNLAVAFYFVPMLATHLFGLHTIFAISGWSYFNTTFLMLVATLTHLLVDPLVKAFYLLRVFYGRSRRTGDDLRLILVRERSGAARATAALALLALGGLLFASNRTAAAETATRPVAPLVAAPAADLDRALDRALAQPDFRWRLHPLPLAPDRKSEGLVAGFLRSSIATFGEIFRTVFRWLEKAGRWIGNLLPDRKESADPAGGAGPNRGAVDWMEALQIAAYVLLCGVIVLLVLVAMRVWRHNRRPPARWLSGAVPAGAPDLRDENVQASRLPMDGWLDLARRQMAAGEWRLALRALFLATLAGLAQDRLVTLARFKTNLDYEHELLRRAHSRASLVDEFRGRRREFEDVWYGAAPAEAGRVTDWLRQLEGRT